MGASFETNNRGVSALAASMIKNIIEILPGAEISLLISNKTSNTRKIRIAGQNIIVKVVNYRLSPKANIREHLFTILLFSILQRIIPFKIIKDKIINSNLWLKTLKDADFVGNIHGGDSFSDIYGLKRFVLDVIPDFILLLLNKKLILLPQTYGPYNHFIARWLAGFIIRQSHKVISRDKESLAVVGELLGKQDSKDIAFCPDIAFTLDSIKINTINIEPPIEQNIRVPLIGFNINGLMYNGGYTRNNMFCLKLDYKSYSRRLAINILEKTNAHIIFVPHTFGIKGNVNSDPAACSAVLNSLDDSYKDRIHLVMHEYDQSEIKGIIALCDFFVGSRMHACIAALSQGIPTVGIAYSKKFKGVFDSVGVGDMVIDGRFVDTDKAIERTLHYYERREEMKCNIIPKIEDAKSQIKKTFEKIFLDRG